VFLYTHIHSSFLLTKVGYGFHTPNMKFGFMESSISLVALYQKSWGT